MKHTLPFLVTLILMSLTDLHAQSDLVRQGDDAMKSGLYKTAYDLYSQAASHDESNVQLAYCLGEAARLGNDYRNAIRHFSFVSKSNISRQFPDCNFHLATMYKCNGQVDSALYFFEQYASSLPVNEEYKARSHQEIRSCQWILDEVETESNYRVSHESKNINSANSESGAILIGDSLLLYSSLTEMNKSGDFILMQIFQTEVSPSGKPGPAIRNEWGLNSKELHSGNVAYDVRNKRIYFTRCDAESFADIPCDIYMSQLKNNKWQRPVRLGAAVNQEGCSNTQPTIGYLPDSTAILYFSSNREGGMGGFDIWYSILNPDGTPTQAVNLGIPVNSQGNEITPFYDNHQSTLYFSSDWHYGYGGYDVFSSRGERDSWSEPRNLGFNLNSAANDIYFNTNINDTTSQSGYLTSNRKGSSYINGNTCCNDIYSWRFEQRKPKHPAPAPQPLPCSECAKHQNEVLSMLPVALYFHNDEPDPKSKSVNTTASYFQTYNRYMFMREDYKAKQRLLADSASADSICNAIDFFFDEEVHRNCQQFEKIISLLTDDLRNGRRVRLTVNGYASPVHTDAYNFNLSKRRIATVVNQLMLHDNGDLSQYLGSESKGSLIINEVAYGSRQAAEGVSASYRDVGSSVYSVEAAKERRIEIIDYQYMDDDSTLITCLHLPYHALHIGTFTTGEVAEIEVHLTHYAELEKTLDFVNAGDPNVVITGYSKLTPGKDLVIYMRINNQHAEPTVSSFLPLTLRVKGEQVTQTMFLEYTIEKKK